MNNLREEIGTGLLIISMKSKKPEDVNRSLGAEGGGPTT